MRKWKWCEKEVFFSLSSNGICKKCETQIRSKINKNVKIITQTEKLLENKADTNSKLKYYMTIIEKANELSKSERKEIPTYTPLPSIILRKYNAEFD